MQQDTTKPAHTPALAPLPQQGQVKRMQSPPAGLERLAKQRRVLTQRLSRTDLEVPTADTAPSKRTRPISVLPSADWFDQSPFYKTQTIDHKFQRAAVFSLCCGPSLEPIVHKKASVQTDATQSHCAPIALTTCHFLTGVGPVPPNSQLRFTADPLFDLARFDQLDASMFMGVSGFAMASAFFGYLREVVAERLAGSCMYIPIPGRLVNPSITTSKLLLLPLCTAGSFPHALYATQNEYEHTDLALLSYPLLRLIYTLLNIVLVNGGIVVSCISEGLESPGHTQYRVKYTDLQETHELCAMHLNAKPLGYASKYQPTILLNSYNAVRQYLHAFRGAFEHVCSDDLDDQFASVVWACPCCAPSPKLSIVCAVDSVCRHLRAAHHILGRVLKVPDSSLNWHEAWCNSMVCSSNPMAMGWVRIPRNVQFLSELLDSMGLGGFSDTSIWTRAYHGTKFNCLKQILSTGIRPPNAPVLGGTRKLGGSVSGSHAYVYASLSFVYAALFSDPYKVTFEDRTVRTHVILECCIRTKSFRVGPETIGASARNIVVDKEVPNNKLELFVAEYDSVFPVAVWVFVGNMDEHPYQKLRSQFS